MTTDSENKPAPKKKAARKPVILGTIMKGIGCPKCRQEMRVIANTNALKCMNPSCDNYGTKFNFPAIELTKCE